MVVPDTLDQALAPEWVTGALQARCPGVVVTAVEPGPVVSRVSTNARFRITRTGDAPENLCVKGYFDNLAARAAGIAEVLFYRDVAPVAGVRTLRCLYADVGPTDHGVVVTEDVVAGGGVFLDGTSDYSVDQLADSLGQLAGLHARTWGDPRWAAASWLDPRMERTLAARGVAEIRGNFESDIGAGVPAEVRDAQRLVDNYRRLVAEVAGAPDWAVVHGDAHIGNVFLAGDGRPAFLDWQLVQRAPWSVDVGYHLASALPVETRRAHEVALLQHYLDVLEKEGGPVIRFDDAWRAIDQGILHGFFLWGVTLKVAPHITTSLLTRLGAAAADHRVFVQG